MVRGLIRKIKKKVAKHLPVNFPWQQCIMVFLTVFPEVLISHMFTPLYPFVSSLLLRNDPDKKNLVSYYVGLLHSSIHLPTIFCNFLWGDLSDKYGRRNMLLIGLFGYSFAAFFVLGFASSLNAAIVGLIITGTFSGNPIVAKSMIGDLLPINQYAIGFTIYGTVFGLSGILGTLLGGHSIGPVGKLNDLSTNFWTSHPFFIPCSIGSVLAFICGVSTYIYLPNTTSKYTKLATNDPIELVAKTPHDEQEVRDDTPRPRTQRKTPKDAEEIVYDGDTTKQHQSFIVRIFIVFSNPKTCIPLFLYSIYCLGNSCFSTALPLLASAPISEGGFGLLDQPKEISKILAVASSTKLFVKIFFALIHSLLGGKAKRLFRCGCVMLIPGYLLLPLQSVAIDASGKRDTTLLYIATFLTGASEGLTYLSVVTWLTEISSGVGNAGLIHGIAGTLGALSKTLGPGVSGMVFYYSKFLVFHIVSVVMTFAFCLSFLA